MVRKNYPRFPKTFQNFVNNSQNFFNYSSKYPPKYSVKFTFKIFNDFI